MTGTWLSLGNRDGAENLNMNANILPAYGSHDDLSSHIERTETLLFNALLLPPAPASGARAVIVSRDRNNQHWLRVCEGSDERWMRWSEQRPLRMRFGGSYAETLAQAAITRAESMGWTLVWSLRAEDVPVLAQAA